MAAVQVASTHFAGKETGGPEGWRDGQACTAGRCWNEDLESQPLLLLGCNQWRVTQAQPTPPEVQLPPGCRGEVQQGGGGGYRQVCTWGIFMGGGLESKTRLLSGHGSCALGPRVEETGRLGLREPAPAKGASQELFPPLLLPSALVFRSPSPLLCFCAQSPWRLP